MKQKTHELALCGVFCALAVTLLWMSGVLPLATYAWPLLASLTLLPVREQCRRSYAWSCFAASALLGLLLCADKEAALLYCFLGYYPLLKPRLDRVRPRALRFACKLALCLFTVGTMYALILFVFRLPGVAEELSATAPWLLWLTVGTGLLLFFVFDLALSRFTALYRRKRERRR